jgi:hypothetical protein
MAAEFERRAGYSAIRFLPLLAGWSLADRETQERFLYDWRKTVSDRLIESHYATGRTFLASFGVSLIAEAGGPGPPIWDSNPVDGIKALGAVDIPRGVLDPPSRDFWSRDRLGGACLRQAPRRRESHHRRRWVDGPLSHRDRRSGLGEGLNCFLTRSPAPRPRRLPDWAYHAGTDINPSATCGDGPG